MAGEQGHPVFRFLHRFAAPDRAGGAPDGELLARFAARQDEAAFAALLRRHGPTVLGVCRRVLHDAHDVDDAFQATFLVLVSRAASLGWPELLGHWLYGVAYRVARRARADAARRRARESRVRAVAAVDPADEAARRDLRRVLDDELSRLPEKYRVPVVLCYLEGRTQEEAARRLGCPRKTVTTRLARACERLKARLTRRGVALPAGAAAAVLVEAVEAPAVPPALAGATLKAATLFAAGQAAAAGVASARVAALTKEVLKAMWITRLKTAGVLLLAACVFGTAVGVYSFRTQAADPPGAKPAGQPKAVARATGQPEEAPKKTDQEQLQGTWTLTAAEVGGKKATAEEIKTIGGQVLFAGDKAVMTQGGRVEEVTFRLDPAKRPKEMNIVFGFTEVHRAIYRLDGNTLTICKSHPPADRPTAFATKAGSKWPMLLTYKKTAESDLTRMQGTWTIVTIEAGGKADDRITKGKIVIAGNTLAHVKPDGTKGSYGTIQLDPAKSPKQVDMTAADGPNKDATFPAIYELDGDRLTFCMARTWARPTEFKTRPGHQELLYVLKRDKP
jgi:RNA polymerase sigma-70 factor (ECF subfamily)